MTMHRGRLSEKEKLYFMCLLFPLFWPFIPVLIVCDIAEEISSRIKDAYWRWKYRNEPPPPTSDAGDD